MSADNPAATPADVPVADLDALEGSVNQKAKEAIDAVASGTDTPVRDRLVFGLTEVPADVAERMKAHPDAGAGLLGAMVGDEIRRYEASKAPGNIVKTTTATGPDDRVRVMDARVNSNGVAVDTAGRPLPEADAIVRGFLDSDAAKAYEASKTPKNSSAIGLNADGLLKVEPASAEQVAAETTVRPNIPEVPQAPSV